MDITDFLDDFNFVDFLFYPLFAISILIIIKIPLFIIILLLVIIIIIMNKFYYYRCHINYHFYLYCIN